MGWRAGETEASRVSLSSSRHTRPYKAESPVWSVEAEGLIKEFSRTKIKSTFIER